MITLLRWILLKQKEIKWKLSFYQFLDKQLKNPEELEKKLIQELAGFVHSISQDNPVNTES